MGKQSKGKTQRWQIVVQSYECPTCGAPPGHPCETTTSQPKREPHADRARLAEARDWRAADEPDGPQCIHCRQPLRLWQGIWVDKHESIHCPESKSGNGHVCDPWEGEP